MEIISRVFKVRLFVVSVTNPVVVRKHSRLFLLQKRVQANGRIPWKGFRLREEETHKKSSRKMYEPVVCFSASTRMFRLTV